MTPKFQAMNTPRTRAEFELRFHYLHDACKNKKMHISTDMSNMVESMLRLRPLPNGRLDFLSVDEAARLQANTMFQFKDMDLQSMIPSENEQDPSEGT